LSWNDCARVEVIDFDDDAGMKSEHARTEDRPKGLTLKSRRTNHDSEPLALYFADVSRHPLLSAADEVRLAQEIELATAARERLEESRAELTAEECRDLRRSVRRGEEAWQTFVQSNLRLVVAIAQKYHAPGVAVLDLIQEGNVGLMHAVGKFDWRMGFKFSTYASWWIRESIERCISSTKSSIRLPRQVGQQVTRLHRAQTRLEMELGRPATKTELATELAIPEPKVDELIRLATQPLSLSAPIGRDGGTLEDLIEGRTADVPGEEILNAAMSEAVEALLGHLDERERRIISLRYGLDDGEPRTYAEVATHFALTGERVRQIEVKAKARLRAEVSRAAAGDLLNA
jgi:RNA polymerase sigma factor (sigma-70 family)